MITDTSKKSTLQFGERMHEFASQLYPICRSITGEGTRQTLRAIQDRIGIEIHAVPSGTPVFDWTIPEEWNVREAYIADGAGRRVVDMNDHNLHLLNYSEPVQTKLPLSKLREHLYTLPEQPGLIPYRTSYYKRQWGFCLSHDLLESIPEDNYEVVIDSTLEAGHLNYGELLIAGQSEHEVLLSTHVCHPSLANDNLSGIALLTQLAEMLQAQSNRYSYRFLFVPGTIGSITWLARNEADVAKIQHGLVVACVGDPGHFHYKKSRRDTAEIDRVVEHILRRSGAPYSIRDFSPYGYDERQYCSPGFDLPVGSLTRTPHGQFAEYHTSADNLQFITPFALNGSYLRYKEVIDVLEANRAYVNQNPKCEPQLGSRGLYSLMGGYADAKDDQMAMLWMLNLSDGTCSILDIAERSGMSFERLAGVAQILVENELLMPL
jgi:aminopeptidase-like protein